MAKQKPMISGNADELILQIGAMAEKVEGAVRELLQANREIDLNAESMKRPNIEKIKQLNATYMRLTGKSLVKEEAPGSGGGIVAGRKRRSSALMEELAKQIADVLSHNKNGISGPDIRKAVAGLEETDNISLLLKKYKHKFATKGPRATMRYLPE